MKEFKVVAVRTIDPASVEGRRRLSQAYAVIENAESGQVASPAPDSAGGTSTEANDHGHGTPKRQPGQK